MPAIQLKTDISARAGDVLVIKDGDVFVLTKAEMKDIDRLKKKGAKPDYSDPNGPLKAVEQRRNALYELIMKKPARVNWLLANLKQWYGVNKTAKFLIMSDIQYLLKHKLIVALKKEGRENIYGKNPKIKTQK